MMTERPRHRFAAVALAASALLMMTVACAPREVMPAPECANGGSSLIAAQSVPGATQIPCLQPLPRGWAVSSVEIGQNGTIVRLDSDRAGDNAAELRLEQTCDTSSAVAVPSDQTAAARYDEVERLEPGFRAHRYYVFGGGCVSWRFDFDPGVSATESVAIGDTLMLEARDLLDERVRDSFVDEGL